MPTERSQPNDRERKLAPPASEGLAFQAGDMLAFQAGDASAFDRIVLQYQAQVRHFLRRRYLRDVERIEDLTQEVFVRVFRSRETYQPTASFRTWLFTIATRLALNEIRGLRRRRRVFSESQTEDDTGQAPWERAADHREEPPVNQMEHEELNDLIDRLIDELPANQKTALTLSRVHELSYKEIADALEVSVMAVKSLLMRARETLRRRLGPYLTSETTDSESNREADVGRSASGE